MCAVVEEMYWSRWRQGVGSRVASWAAVWHQSATRRIKRPRVASSAAVWRRIYSGVTAPSRHARAAGGVPTKPDIASGERGDREDSPLFPLSLFLSLSLSLSLSFSLHLSPSLSLFISLPLSPSLSLSFIPLLSPLSLSLSLSSSALNRVARIDRVRF